MTEYTLLHFFTTAHRISIPHLSPLTLVLINSHLFVFQLVSETQSLRDLLPHTHTVAHILNTLLKSFSSITVLTYKCVLLTPFQINKLHICRNNTRVTLLQPSTINVSNPFLFVQISLYRSGVIQTLSK